MNQTMDAGMSAMHESLQEGNGTAETQSGNPADMASHDDTLSRYEGGVEVGGQTPGIPMTNSPVGGEHDFRHQINDVWQHLCGMIYVIHEEGTGVELRLGAAVVFKSAQKDLSDPSCGFKGGAVTPS